MNECEYDWLCISVYVFIRIVQYGVNVDRCLKILVENCQRTPSMEKQTGARMMPYELQKLILNCY